jgi:hypothetical protein
VLEVRWFRLSVDTANNERSMQMTDKQQPPIVPERMPERLYVIDNKVEQPVWRYAYIKRSAPSDIEYARVHQTDDGRLKQIRWRAEIDGYRKLTLQDGNTSLALVQARADVVELLSLLPQLSSSECRCGECQHAEGVDPRGRCIAVQRDPGGSAVYCGCKCEERITP